MTVTTETREELRRLLADPGPEPWRIAAAAVNALPQLLDALEAAEQQRNELLAMCAPLTQTGEQRLEAAEQRAERAEAAAAVMREALEPLHALSERWGRLWQSEHGSRPEHAVWALGDVELTVAHLQAADAALATDAGAATLAELVRLRAFVARLRFFDEPETPMDGGQCWLEVHDLLAALDAPANVPPQ